MLGNQWTLESLNCDLSSSGWMDGWMRNAGNCSFVTTESHIPVIDNIQSAFYTAVFLEITPQFKLEKYLSAQNEMSNCRVILYKKKITMKLFPQHSLWIVITTGNRIIVKTILWKFEGLGIIFIGRKRRRRRRNHFICPWF